MTTFYSCHISLDIIYDVLWFLTFNDLRCDIQQCICFCFVLQTVYDVLHANITKEGSNQVYITILKSHGMYSTDIGV